MKRLRRRGIERGVKDGRTFLVPTLTAVLLFAGCTSDAQTPKGSAARSHAVVLELFTSQGCSSCPPADRLLSTLRREDFDGSTVIPLAYHVDYWNYIGWTDPFSSPRWSQRQREYARVMKSSQVYTPQLVINGSVQLVGSAEAPIRAEIDRQLAHAEDGAVFIDRIERSAGSLNVHVRARNDKHANLVVTLFENGVTTAVSRGENANRRLANDAIVRWQGVAGGPAVTIPLDTRWRADHLGVAAFLQDPSSLAIYAASARNVTEN